MQITVKIEVVRTQPFKALAVRALTAPDKSGTRKAWQTLTEHIPLNDPRWVDTDTAYVFIPQNKWSTHVDTLWVGLAAREFGEIPDGIEPLELPETLCAKVHVHGNEARMREAYDAMFRWLRESAEYELDTRQGVLGMEANRLTPLNPFTVSYEEVGTFDFDMLYPIRSRRT